MERFRDWDVGFRFDRRFIAEGLGWELRPRVYP